MHSYEYLLKANITKELLKFKMFLEIPIKGSCQNNCVGISEKVLHGGRARCPTYEKSITYIPVGRAPSPAKGFFQSSRWNFNLIIMDPEFGPEAK
jgi:hypothetical protein